MCDEIGVIDNGKLMATGSVSQIQMELQQQKVITMTVSSDVERTVRFFEDDPDVMNVHVLENGTIEFGYRGSDDSQQMLIKKAVLADIPLLSFKPIEKNLEDVFMEITKGVE